MSRINTITQNTTTEHHVSLLIDELISTMRTLAPSKTIHKPHTPHKHSNKSPYTNGQTEKTRTTLDKLNQHLHHLHQLLPLHHHTSEIANLHTQIIHAQQQYKLSLTNLYIQWSTKTRTELTTLKHGGGGVPAAREGLGMGHHWATMLKTIQKGENNRPTPDKPSDAELAHYFTQVFQPNTTTSSHSQRPPSATQTQQTPTTITTKMVTTAAAKMKYRKGCGHDGMYAESLKALFTCTGSRRRDHRKDIQLHVATLLVATTLVYTATHPHTKAKQTNKQT
jgi:hypothetical protein